MFNLALAQVKISAQDAEFIQKMKEVEAQSKRTFGVVRGEMVKPNFLQMHSQHWGKVREQAIGALKAIEQQAIKTAKSIGRLTMGVAVGGAAGATGILKLGMDAVESENLFSVSLGKMSASARKWTEEYSRLYRLNPFAQRAQLGTLSTFLQGMGMKEGQAAATGASMLTLVNDLSSYYNRSREEMFQRVMSGLAGEIEPMRRLGISLTDDQIKQYAITHGLATPKNLADRQARYGRGSLKDTRLQSAKPDDFEELTEPQKLSARLGLIWEKTRLQRGDLGRTINSPANLLRGMKDELTGAFTTVGMRFFDEGTPLNRLLKDTYDWVHKISEKLKAWADSDGPLRLQQKLVQMFKEAQAKAIELWETAKAKFDEFRKQIEDFWERNRIWLKPALGIGVTAGAGYGLSKMLGGKKQADIQADVVNVYANKIGGGGGILGAGASSNKMRLGAAMFMPGGLMAYGLQHMGGSSSWNFGKMKGIAGLAGVGASIYGLLHLHKGAAAAALAPSPISASQYQALSGGAPGHWLRESFDARLPAVLGAAGSKVSSWWTDVWKTNAQYQFAANARARYGHGGAAGMRYPQSREDYWRSRLGEIAEMNFGRNRDRGGARDAGSKGWPAGHPLDFGEQVDDGPDKVGKAVAKHLGRIMKPASGLFVFKQAAHEFAGMTGAM